VNPFTHNTTKPLEILYSSSSISLLQLMHCLKSVRPKFQLFCRSMSTCHRQTLPVSRNIVTSRCTVVLFGTSISRYALLNASRTAANDFNAKQYSRMNTRSARENTIFEPAQVLRNWREHRPSNQGDLDSCHGEGWKSLLHGGGPASDFIFVPKYVTVVGLRYKLYALHV
jgi:hypothetical protein